MAGSGRAAEKLRCEGCHRGAVHADARLEKHARRVACTACHIPAFARVEATDLHRDWSRAQKVEGEGRWEPTLELRKDVVPVYAWWNGKGSVHTMDEPVRLTAGKVRLWSPEGSRSDPTAKIAPFKLHTARLPVSKSDRKLIPIKAAILFSKGDATAAVRAGAAATGRGADAEWDWVESERYMGVFHGIPPADRALGCQDCHGALGRLDWKGLGYPSDPAPGAARSARPSPSAAGSTGRSSSRR